MVGSEVIYTVVIKPENHLVFGAESIGKILKRGRKEIPHLVRDRGLKAWQDGEKGQWRALCADLLEFNTSEKDRSLNTVNS